MKTSIALVGVLAALVISGCTGKSASAPAAGAVTDLHVDQVGTAPSVSSETPVQPVVDVTVTLNKSKILGNDWLYGADLQYSSFYDADFDLYQQALAIGHIPARFRIAGNELQLIADNKRMFPSDANHPEMLISRFKIVSQTATTITVKKANSAVFLGQVFEGTHTDTKGRPFNIAGKPPRDLWARSFNYDPNGDYLLQETSVVLDDGSTAEFMESMFPAQSIAASATFEKFEMDPANPIGADQGVPNRYRLIGGEPIFKGEKKYTMGSHFDIALDGEGKGGTIDWYVTRNIPDEYVDVVKMGVEGWNRYFNAMDGVKRPVMRFMGKLPEGTHLGDPRYNTIAWDSRLVAGAAYESQAADPMTGKMSHSLIYLPAAWVQIGRDYWKLGQFSDAAKPEIAAAPKSRWMKCLRDIREGMLLMASGRIPQMDIETFGKGLLRGTLFHEVGHALGLGHNFKGSLSYEVGKPETFSASIMDYNNFEIERAAFNGPDTAEGPLLEYDRQAISAIYDGAKNVKSTDAVMPACADEEADNEDGGVDPLCIRYDVEKDPTHGIVTAFDRINNETKDGDMTLAQAIGNVTAGVLDDTRVAAITTQADFDKLTTELKTGVSNSLQYFISRGRSAVSRTVRNNTKSLLVFGGELPEGYKDAELRERALKGVNDALALKALPEPSAKALGTAADALIKALEASPYGKGLEDGARKDAGAKAAQSVVGLADSFAANASTGIVSMRVAVLKTLARHEKVPFFFDGTNDIESSLVKTLSDVLVGALKGTDPERAAAATAIVTYKGRSQGDLAIKGALAQLELERTQAKNNDSRESTESLIQTLTGK